MRSIFIALVVINAVVLVALIFMRPEVPSGAGVPVVVRPSELGGEPLQLLRERGEEASMSEGVVEAKKMPVVPESGSDDPSVMCTMVGPYVQLLHAEYLVDRLRALDAEAKVRSLEVPDGMGYWVYLPPEASDKEALRRLYELQAKKIDSYVIPNGELSRGISLGIFNDRAAADARVISIGEQGYQPELREVARTISETWVVMSVAEAEKIDAELWVDILRQQSGLEKRQNFCLGVAPQ
jgi:hypothetical protein